MALKGEELKIEVPKSMKNFENPVNEWMNACMHDWLTEWMNESEWMHACMNARVERWLHLFYGFNLLIKDDTSKANTNYSDNYSLTIASLSIFKTYIWTQTWDILSNLIGWF